MKGRQTHPLFSSVTRGEVVVWWCGSSVSGVGEAHRTGCLAHDGAGGGWLVAGYTVPLARGREDVAKGGCVPEAW